MTSLGSCNIQTAVDKAVAAIDDAIGRLDAESSSWQQLLVDLQSKISAEINSTVRNELSTFVTRAIQQGGIQLRCGFANVSEYIKQGLLTVRAHLKRENPPPRPQPKICSSTPSTVTVGNTLNLEYDGFDLDTFPEIQAILIDDDDSVHNVTKYVSQPSIFQLTSGFGPNGIQLGPQSRKLQLRYNDSPISTVLIQQPLPPKCDTPPSVLIHANPITVPASFVAHGDTEFHGNGPTMDAGVTLNESATTLTISVAFEAQEIGGDGSDFRGAVHDVEVYKAPAGYDIVSVSSSVLETHVHFTGVDHDMHPVPTGNTLVDRVEFWGDGPTDRDDQYTRINVVFNPQLAVTVRQVSGCTP